MVEGEFPSNGAGTAEPLRGKQGFLGPARWWLTGLLVVSLPFRGFAVFSVAGGGVTPAMTVAAVLVLTTAVDWLLNGVDLRSPDWWALAFLATGVFSLTGQVFGADLHLASFTTLFVQKTLYVFMFLSISSLDVSVTRLDGVLRVLLYVALVLVAYGLYQGVASLTGADLPLATLQFNNPSLEQQQRLGGYGAVGFFRVASVFNEPSWYGGFLVWPLIVASGFAIAGPMRIAASATAAAMFGGLVQSGSLAGYVGAAGGASVLAVVLWRRHGGAARRYVTRRMGRFITGLVGMLAVGGFWVRRNVEGQFFADMLDAFGGGIGPALAQLHSFSFRLRMIVGGLRRWAEGGVLETVFGLGLNALDHQPLADWTGRNLMVSSVPTAYVQTIVDQGVVGLVALLGLFGAVLWRLRTGSITYPGGRRRWLGRVIPLIFVAVVASDAVLLLTEGLGMEYWVHLGLAAHVGRFASRDAATSE